MKRDCAQPLPRAWLSTLAAWRGSGPENSPNLGLRCGFPKNTRNAKNNLPARGPNGKLLQKTGGQGTTHEVEISSSARWISSVQHFATRQVDVLMMLVEMDGVRNGFDKWGIDH
jgi:hypothetical protein